MTIQGAIDETVYPTGQCIYRLTIESNGRISEGGCIEGPTSCGLKVYEIPLPAKPGEQKMTKLSMQFARVDYRKCPPFWWSGKLQRAAEMWLADKQMKLRIAYQNRQRKIAPTGYNK